MELNYTKEEIIKMYYELTRKEFAEKLGLTSYSTSQLIKQLGLSKPRGAKPIKFEFKNK